MLLNDRVGDSQPEPGTLADFLGREERIEDLRLQLLWDPRPIVVDLETTDLALHVVPGADDEHAAVVR